MDGVMRRREMVQTGGTEDYVRDGLIFFLDGLNRGGVAGQWTDTISGITFTLYKATEYDNGIQLTAGQGTTGGRGYYAGYATPTGWSSQTIECACSGAKANRYLFSDKGNARISLVQGGAVDNMINTAIIADGTSRARWLLPVGTKLISINNDIGVGDLQSISKGANDSWTTNNSDTMIGKRDSGWNRYSFDNIIYAIRVYNRKLTADEMKQNQRVDMRRYGITI